MDAKALEEGLAVQDDQGRSFQAWLSEILELAGNARLSYEIGIPEERRVLLKKVSSNRHVDGKKVVVELSSPYYGIANKLQNTKGDPNRARLRTIDDIFKMLVRQYRTCITTQ